MAPKDAVLEKGWKAILLRLLINDRFWLLCFSGLLSGFVWLLVSQLVPPGELQIIRLEQIYGFLSTTYLYFALLASPITKTFPRFPGKDKYLHLRRAIGVSSFYFGALHASIGFFGQLKGFDGLSFLSSRYNLALILGALALFILLLLAATSIDKVIDRMTFPRWKKLHRFIYAAGWLALGHAVLIGTHFSGSSSLPGRVVLVAVIFLLLLEALRLDRIVGKRIPRFGHIGVVSMLVMHVLFVGFGFLIGRSYTPSIQEETVSEEHGHGATHNASVQTLKQQVDKWQVEINQVRFDLNKLVSGQEFITFRVSPTFNFSEIDCFLIHNESQLYVQGFTKLGSTGEIICAPLGDSQPPFVGYYYAYLHIKGADGSLATKFDIDIQ